MMMTHRERILRVFKGERVDRIPYVPRIDLWHNANELAGTLPERFRGLSVEEIHRKQGWPLHKVVPEYLKPERPEDIVHRGIGFYRLKEFPYDFEFSRDVEIRVEFEEGPDERMTHVEYHTPQGMVSVRHGTTAEMKRSGASITWIKEHAVKGPEDYRVLAHIFGNLRLTPAYERFSAWKASVGEDGVAVGQGLGIACSSPMHFIQKTLMGATQFYYHYHDHPREVNELAEALESVFDQVVPILADCPADAILWSGNVDDMITYPAYFEKEILPWCLKASERIRSKGKIMIIHPDGENRNLMDLIARCGMDVADAVTPYPMTKVPIGEYYDRWCRKGALTIHGGIPEMMLLGKSTTWEDLKSFLDHLFEAIAPGDRFVASIGDTTPAHADFDRLEYIGDRFEKGGRLPLKPAGAGRVAQIQPLRAEKQTVGRPGSGDDFGLVRQAVLKGDEKRLKSLVLEMLGKGCEAGDIVRRGMLPAMEAIGGRFKDGTVFIPEVLLSARAMNETLKVLEPHLAPGEREERGRIMVGTVWGDLHDIGKNMVLTMLKGVGFETIDLGVNVKAEEFVRRVAEVRPDILGLSALLTTTMPQMEAVILKLKDAGLRDKVRIMVGGAPVNEKFALQIGADGYAHDAGEAVSLARRLLQAAGC